MPEQQYSVNDIEKISWSISTKVTCTVRESNQSPIHRIELTRRLDWNIVSSCPISETLLFDNFFIGHLSPVWLKTHNKKDETGYYSFKHKMVKIHWTAILNMIEFQLTCMKKIFYQFHVILLFQTDSRRQETVIWLGTVKGSHTDISIFSLVLPGFIEHISGIFPGCFVCTSFCHSSSIQEVVSLAFVNFPVCCKKMCFIELLEYWKI
jgi:hypothetical protein